MHQTKAPARLAASAIAAPGSCPDLFRPFYVRRQGCTHGGAADRRGFAKGFGLMQMGKPAIGQRLGHIGAAHVSLAARSAMVRATRSTR